MPIRESTDRLSNAERQRRWRQRRQALVKAHPEVAERELIAAAQRCEQLSDPERIALADKLAGAALRYQHRATTALARLAMQGRNHRQDGSAPKFVYHPIATAAAPGSLSYSVCHRPTNISTD